MLWVVVWQEEGAVCVECLAVFSLPFPFLFPTVYQCLLSPGCGGSQLVCQVLPAIGAVSILQLAANSGGSGTQPALSDTVVKLLRATDSINKGSCLGACHFSKLSLSK